MITYLPSTPIPFLFTEMTYIDTKDNNINYPQFN
jgi:hypothetical protein